MLSQKFVINVIFLITPLPPAAYSNKKKRQKEQCTIINTMCIEVKHLYALNVQLSEPLNSLYTLATGSKLVPDKTDKISNRLGKYAGPRMGLCGGSGGLVGTQEYHKKHIFLMTQLLIWHSGPKQSSRY